MWALGSYGRWHWTTPAVEARLYVACTLRTGASQRLTITNDSKLSGPFHQVDSVRPKWDFWPSAEAEPSVYKITKYSAEDEASAEDLKPSAEDVNFCQSSNTKTTS